MKKRVWGIILGVVGVAVLSNSYSGITGLAVFESIGKQAGSVIGAVLVIGGVLLMMNSGKGENYYRKRASELTRYEGDSWIAQSEAEGVLNELYDRGYEIEHGRNKQAVHLTGGGPKGIPHVFIAKGRVKKHIFITNDPYDKRVRQIGFREKKGKLERIMSNAYHPKHPRRSGKEKRKFTDKVEITLGKPYEEN